LVSLRGNHEIMMLQSKSNTAMRESWLTFGGEETLWSYATEYGPGTLDEVPGAHWDFMDDTCRDWYESETHFFVHANAYPHLPLADQPYTMLYWMKFNDPPPHCSCKIMVCGHTPQKSGVPLNIGHGICIDRWVYGRGWLTCLDVATGRYWQGNEQGDSREGSLA